MRQRIPQPPIQPFARDPERHDFAPGFIAALIGLIVLLCGVRHMTRIDTTDGNTAWETQLIKAFSSGGIQYANLSAPPPPPPPDPANPAAHADALLRWERDSARASAGPRWKVQVNTGASTPCPT